MDCPICKGCGRIDDPPTVPEPGEHIKVSLFGETPWAQVTGEQDGMAVARIDNDLLFTAEHGRKFGDVLLFRPCLTALPAHPAGYAWEWVVAEMGPLTVLDGGREAS